MHWKANDVPTPGKATHVWMHSNAGTDISDLCRHKYIHTLYLPALAAGTETLNMPSLDVSRPISFFANAISVLTTLCLFISLLLEHFPPLIQFHSKNLPLLPVLSQNSLSNIIGDSSESINEVCTMLMSLVLAADTTKFALIDMEAHIDDEITCRL